MLDGLYPIGNVSGFILGVGADGHKECMQIEILLPLLHVVLVCREQTREDLILIATRFSSCGRRFPTAFPTADLHSRIIHDLDFESDG